MMEKIIPVGSWDFQMEPTALIRVASSGLRGSDRHSFLVKRAADHVFADLVDKIALHPGDIPIHALRMRGVVANQEVILGAQGQTLTIRHDTVERSSFMPGVVLACKKISQHKGFTLGLDSFLGI